MQLICFIVLVFFDLESRHAIKPAVMCRKFSDSFIHDKSDWCFFYSGDIEYYKRMKIRNCARLGTVYQLIRQDHGSSDDIDGVWRFFCWGFGRPERKGANQDTFIGLLTRNLTCRGSMEWSGCHYRAGGYRSKRRCQPGLRFTDLDSWFEDLWYACLRLLHNSVLEIIGDECTSYQDQESLRLHLRSMSDWL